MQNEKLGRESLLAIKDYVDAADNSKEDKANKTVSLSSAATDAEYPSAKAVYDFVITDGGKIDSISINGEPQAIANKNVDLPAYPTRESLEIDNVDNTNDLDKPISTATQSALDLKVDKTDGILRYNVYGDTAVIGFIDSHLEIINKIIQLNYRQNPFDGAYVYLARL